MYLSFSHYMLDINCVSVLYSSYSRATAARTAWRSTMTMGREPHANIETENQRTLFSWSTWLTACIAGASPQRRNDATQHFLISYSEVSKLWD